MNNLRPCPFCGSANVELRKGVVMNGAVHCNHCTADVVFDAVRLVRESNYDWQTAVTNGWNERCDGTWQNSAK